ncbi:hypothetical protein ABBQ38_012091 [Trebouxia sp. C0009 RCD-2024]
MTRIEAQQYAAEMELKLQWYTQADSERHRCKQCTTCQMHAMEQRELQQQALLEGHVVLAGTYQSFGLGLMRADLQVCIYKAAPKLPRGTYWQTHFSIGILGMLVHENAPEAIWLGISAAACCVVCSSIYTVGPEQQNHSGSCACSFNPSKFGLSKAVWADVPAVTVVRASAA